MKPNQKKHVPATTSPLPWPWPGQVYRQTFQLKKEQTWELVQNVGGVSSKNQKSPKIQLGKVQN